MRKYKKLIDILCKIEEWITLSLLIVLIVVTSLGIISRYFFHSPIVWTEELARFVFIWMISFAVGYCVTKHDHVRVEMFVNMMPEKAHRVIDLILSVMTLAFFLYLIPYSFKFMIAQDRIRSTALHLPFSYVYSGVLIASVLIVIHLFYNFLVLLKGKEE